MDWTDILVALIGLLGTVLTVVITHCLKTYVNPWLEQHDLTEAAEIVVNAVEALLGRYTGDDKWQLALEKMEALGWNVDAQQVIDALKAAWQKLNLKQIEAGVKDAEAPSGKEETEDVQAET